MNICMANDTTPTGGQVTYVGLLRLIEPSVGLVMACISILNLSFTTVVGL